MKLTTMTDFFLEQRKTYNGDFEDLADLYYRYAKFLKQPLELGMFVPCDKNGNVLEEPIEPEYPYNDKECDVWSQYEMYLRRYQKTKERCLFEGWNLRDYHLLMTQNVKTIEDLVKHKPELTQTALKQIGL